MCNNQIKQFHGFSVSLYWYTSVTLAIDKLNSRGLSNNVRGERLPKKDKAVLATELPGSSNKSECFSYKSEWANL